MRKWPLSILLALGCEPAEVEGIYPERDAAPTADAALVTADAGVVEGEALDDVEGVWMLYMQDRSCLTALGSSVEQIITTTYRVEIEGLGVGGLPGEEHVRQRLQMCKQEVSPAVGGLITTIPPEVIDSLPVHTLDGALALALDDAGRPTSAPTRYWTTELMDLWGVPPDFSTTAPLPTEAEDEAVRDQDADGAPGVTLVLGNDLCDIYVVQRTRQRLGGYSVSPIRVEGTFSSVVEQRVLGATNRLCETENTTTVGPNPYPFTLLRVDGAQGALSLDLDGDGEITCAELVSAEPALVDGDTLQKVEPEPGACDDSLSSR